MVELIVTCTLASRCGIKQGYYSLGSSPLTIRNWQTSWRTTSTRGQTYSEIPLNMCRHPRQIEPIKIRRAQFNSFTIKLIGRASLYFYYGNTLRIRFTQCMAKNMWKKSVPRSWSCLIYIDTKEPGQCDRLSQTLLSHGLVDLDFWFFCMGVLLS